MGLRLSRGQLVEGFEGWYDPDAHTITIDERLDDRRARWVLAHEIVHAERGDSHTGTAWGELRQEHVVDAIAARMLLPIDAFADALIGAGDEFHVAEALGVDIETVRLRLSDLTDAERDYIDTRVHRAIPVAPVVAIVPQAS